MSPVSPVFNTKESARNSQNVGGAKPKIYYSGDSSFCEQNPGYDGIPKGKNCNIMCFPLFSCEMSWGNIAR